MAKADVLARVRADLTAGHTHVAVQRLRTLLATLPDDLEIRSMLASVYRQTGNSVEAGRWGFLTADVRPDELVAFARANPDPWLRLRLLHFTGDADALSEAAQSRLVELTEEAEKSGPPSRWVGSYQAPKKVRSAAWPCLFTTVVLTATILLAAVGVLQLMSWVLG